MSETVSPTPEVPATPIAAVDSAGVAPGPTSGTTPPGAGAEAASAPAADLPPQAAAEADPSPPATEPVDPLSTSLLGEVKPPETPEAPAEEVKPAEPLPLPTYETFALPEGVKLDDEKMGAFTGLLGEFEQKLGATPEAHAAAQEFGQKALELYIAERQEDSQRFARLQQETWQRTIDGWVSEFRADPDIGDKRQDTTLQRCGAALTQYGNVVGSEKETALRQVLTMTGAGNHPEVVRFVNWVADLAVEKGRMIAAPPRPVSVAQSKSQRLYRNSISTNGAA